MLFNEKERRLLLNCLDDYEKADVLHTDLNRQLINSCKEKLSALTALTVFSEKEISALNTAVGYIEDCYTYDDTEALSHFSKVPPSGFYSLIQKLDKL